MFEFSFWKTLLLAQSDFLRTSSEYYKPDFTLMSTKMKTTAALASASDMLRGVFVLSPASLSQKYLK